MAHELSFQDNRVEAMYAERPAWHNLGTVLDHAPTSELAIKAAHLDWRVGMRDLWTSDGVKCPHNFATVREDTGEILGVVSARYRIIQNHEAFDFLDGLIQDGLMKYESAGALRGGRSVWLLGRMPSVDVIADGDASLRYVLFSTSHDGTASIHACPTSVRVVCANTLRLATRGDAGFSHTGDIKTKLEVARKFLSQFDEQFTLFRDEARVLASKRFTLDQSTKYLKTLFPEVVEPSRAKTIRDQKVESVRDRQRGAHQQIDSIKGTWWALFNSVTESIDHDGGRKGRGADRQREVAESRFLSNVDGVGADFKAKAFKLALTMAG